MILFTEGFLAAFVFSGFSCCILGALGVITVEREGDGK
jgi:hypothetical protein